MKVEIFASCKCEPAGDNAKTSVDGFIISEMLKEAKITGELKEPVGPNDESDELDEILTDLAEEGWNIDDVIFPERG